MSRAWMPMYWGDYLRDTRNFTTLEHGAYLLLIAEYWSNGPLPADNRSLARIAGLNGYQWGRIHKKLRTKFLHSSLDNTLHHKRIDCELEKAEIAFLKRSFAGQKGGMHKRGRTNIYRAQVEAMRYQPQSKKERKKEDFRGSDELENLVRLKEWKRDG
jgi:uncharacterized protein YdaU (DUF1376 family)